MRKWIWWAISSTHVKADICVQTRKHTSERIHPYFWSPGQMSSEGIFATRKWLMSSSDISLLNSCCYCFRDCCQKGSTLSPICTRVNVRQTTTLLTMSLWTSQIRRLQQGIHRVGLYFIEIWRCVNVKEKAFLERSCQYLTSHSFKFGHNSI